jgi:hypothetical protein
MSLLHEDTNSVSSLTTNSFNISAGFFFRWFSCQGHFHIIFLARVDIIILFAKAPQPYLIE